MLECFKSNVCLLYTFVLHCRAQFDNYMFRKTFSCSRAIRNFETVDKVFSVCTESPTYEKLLCTGNCFAVLSFHVDTSQLGLSEGRAAFMLWGPDTCPASVALRVSLGEVNVRLAIGIFKKYTSSLATFTYVLWVFFN